MKKLATVLLVSILTLFFSACGGGSDGEDTTPAPTISEWDIETVLPIGTYGRYPSLAVDNAATPHISFFSEGYIKYAYKSGTTWKIENVEYIELDGLGDTPSYREYSSIALDANNNPHILYHSYLGITSSDPSAKINPLFKYSRKIEGVWTTTTIPLPVRSISSDGTVSYYQGTNDASIVIDKNNGTAHVSLLLFTGLQTGQALGYWNSSLDRAVVVDIGTDLNTGYKNSIALDNSGFPHISYTGLSLLKYAAWDGSVFSLATLDESTGLVYRTSLAIDQNDNPHIAYYKDGYKYLYRDGSSWTPKRIPIESEYVPIYDFEGSLSLSLDAENKPYIALTGTDSETSQRVQLAYWDGQSWSFDVMEDEDVYDCSVVVDNAGDIHTSYTADSNQKIKHAFKIK